MPLVPAKCPSCGDTVKVDKAKEAAVCPSCGSAFIVEKAIQVYATLIQAENMIINNGDGVTRDNLLKAACNHVNSNEIKPAINALNEAMKRGSLGLLFEKLRSVLRVSNPDRKKCLNCGDLINIADTYKEAWRIVDQKGDTSISPDLAQDLLLSLGVAVASAWFAYVNSLNEILHKETSRAACREELFKLVKYVPEFLEWGEKNGVMLEKEHKNFPVRCRSFWAEMMRHFLERIGYVNVLGCIPTRGEVQAIYDLADEYKKVKGLYRERPFAACLTPIHEGGEGVHVHFKDEFRGPVGKCYKVKVCVSEFEYCQWQADSADISSCLLKVMAVFGIICSAFMLVASEEVAFVCFLVSLFLLVYLASQSGKVPYKVYDEWFNSPVRGTKAPQTTYKEFNDWMKENAEAKAKQAIAKNKK